MLGSDIHVGVVIKRLRKASKYPSLEELAVASGLSISYLSLIERDKREPTVTALTKIADALDVPLPVIFLILYAENSPKTPRSVLNRLARITGEILEESKQTGS